MELLIIIAIAILLSVISIIVLNSARAKARDARRLSDITQIRGGLELYYNENKQYPTTTMVISREAQDTSQPYCLQSGVGFAPAPCNPANGTIFIPLIPLPPAPADGLCMLDNDEGYPNDDGGSISRNYYYYVNYITRYELKFCISSDTQGLSAGQHKANSEGIQ